MRLLVAFPSWMPGGADRTYITPVIPAALTAGWEVHTACSGREDLRPLVRHLESLGATHHTCELAEQPATGLRYRMDQRRFAQRMTRLLEDVAPQRVLLVLPWVSYGLGAMRACSRHGASAAVVFQLVRPGWLPGWRKRATRELLTGSCRPVAVSDNNRTILADMFGLEHERIELIYNGTSITPTDDDDARAAARVRGRTAAGVRDQDLMLLTTARLSSQKGHGYLLDAMPRVVAAHPEAVFVFVGDGPERAAIEARITAAGLQPHVRLLGERSDIEDLSLAADLFVFPTTFEGSPFALLEAMAYGLPVVTTDASGIAEVVRDGSDGIVVEKENPEALASGIRRALGDRSSMHLMAASARERVRQFSADHMAARTLQLLDSL